MVGERAGVVEKDVRNKLYMFVTISFNKNINKGGKR